MSRIYRRYFKNFSHLGDYVLEHSKRLKTFLAYIIDYDTHILVTVDADTVVFEMVGQGGYDCEVGLYAIPVYSCLLKMQELVVYRKRIKE